jgi:hypothetical protein
LTDAGDSPAGAYAGHDRVDLAVRVRPDFLSRRPAVDVWIGRVVELIEDDGAFRDRLKLLGLGYRTRHTLRARCQHDDGA